MASISLTPSWTPPENLRERIKSLVFSPKQQLRRIVARGLRKGEPELRLIPRMVDAGRHAIDVGANRGVWADCLAGQCPGVFAFEPNPKMFAFLRDSCAANVVPSPLALSDCAGEAVLRIPRTARGYSNQQASLAPRADDRFSVFGEMTVATACLDDLALPPCGFIKIDVEGHEAAVLRGASRLIARDRPVLLIELEQRHTGEPIEASLQAVMGMGYAASFLRDGVETPIAGFDPDADHRGRADRPGYVFNFIFRPV
jgi:FkbM family methyltransferase